MPIRYVPPRSERGSIKDIQKMTGVHLEEDPNMPATPSELRLKALYEHALITRDRSLIDSLGLIVMDGSPKDPVSVLRHRQYVQDLSAKLGFKRGQFTNNLSLIVDKPVNYSERKLAESTSVEQAKSLSIILSENNTIVRHASTEHPINILRAFWRVK